MALTNGGCIFSIASSVACLTAAVDAWMLLGHPGVDVREGVWLGLGSPSACPWQELKRGHKDQKPRGCMWKRNLR